MRELTRTNRPFGLTIKLSPSDPRIPRVTLSRIARKALAKVLEPDRESRPFQGRYLKIAIVCFLRCQNSFQDLVRRVRAGKFPGGHIARVTPVPIPNTEVKPR
jgi:hypothetical protein